MDGQSRKQLLKAVEDEEVYQGDLYEIFSPYGSTVLGNLISVHLLHVFRWLYAWEIVRLCIGLISYKLIFLLYCVYNNMICFALSYVVFT